MGRHADDFGKSKSSSFGYTKQIVQKIALVFEEMEHSIQMIQITFNLY